MTNIDSTSRFLSLMRQQVSAAARELRPTTMAAAQPRPDSRGSAPSSQSRVMQGVMAIAPDDPQRRRKAFRIFLESVLADELGKDLLTDPAYHRIVDDVHMTMERNSALASAIDQAGEYLLLSVHKA